ncbi:hypothetical protein ATO12_05560 [Aquimarina atlantica]|uniref:Uncharacterized protein n=1 Tax=Aquimarina atlantica TaxID=1317122 RepID=A0A023BPD7_9FLAO|nr:hypothetical protein [Aquimarina atlantica]EZH71846.1 hypothetical protein ATO12_05560 [Aquimarina atlantica]
MSSLHQYRQLFSVQLLLDYYLTEEVDLYQNTPDNPMSEVLAEQVGRYDLERDLYVEPTPETVKTLKDKKLLFKRNNQGFFVGCQVSDLGAGVFTPFVAMDESFSLKFQVSARNPYFFNFTNIRLEEELANKDQFIYYFSNRANNIVDNNLYLSTPISDFDTSYAYEASEIFVDASDPLNPTMFEAIENNGPGAFDANNWRQIFIGVNPLFQFVTSLDRIVSRPSIFKHDVEIAAEEILTFLIRDSNDTVVKTVQHQTSESGTPLLECELDLSDLESGYYQIEVQNNLGTPIPALSLTCYMDDHIYEERPLAVIECFYEPNESLGEYRWLDQSDSSRLRTPDYTIRWKNRATWWRYYYSGTPDLTSTVLENLDPDVNAPNHRILISSNPLALTQIGREIRVTLGNGDLQLLPNPNVQMIYPENGRIYSELNMGGGFGPPE